MARTVEKVQQTAVETTTSPEVLFQPPPQEQSKAVAIIPEHQSASPLDLPTEIFRAGLDRRRANRAALMEWIRSALVEGVDYGRIHAVGKNKCPLAAQGRGEKCQDPKHWSKPSLFKPGAEKICGMLGVTVYYPTLHEYEQAALRGADIKQVILRCEIRDSAGRAVADGIGARSLEQDYGDLNKALKMAEKSAHIDATLRMAGLSEVFTQDLEDIRKSENQSPMNGAIINSAQHRRLEAHINELGLDCEWVKNRVFKQWGIAHLNELSVSHYEDLYEKLSQWAKALTEKEARAEREAIQHESAPLPAPEPAPALAPGGNSRSPVMA